MEFDAAAMAADLPYDAVSVFQGMLMDRITHIAQEMPGDRRFHADVHAFLRDLHQLLPVLRDVADHEHSGGIREEPAQNGRAVHVDDIALFQDMVAIRDTVADLLVDGGADALREALVVQAGRDGAHLDGGIVDDVIDLLRAHAGAHQTLL